MKLKELTLASCGALLVTASIIPWASADDRDGGPPGEQEVLLVSVTCSNPLPFPDPNALLNISLSLAGSGTVTGTGGALGTTLQGKTGSCLAALADFPQALVESGCSDGSVTGNDNFAQSAGVCEGRRATLIATVASLTRAFLGL